LTKSSASLSSQRVSRLALHPPTRAERERRAALPLDVLGRFEARPNLHAASIPWEWRKDYLDKDLPLLFKVEDRDHFESFATALESRSAQVLNLQETARDVAISHRTAVRWLTALETCFQILLLRPLDDSLGRRQIQAPKLHSWTSLHFETQTVAELYRNAQHSAAGASFRYWRDSNGFEIPLVLVESSGRRLPVGIAPEAAPGQEASLERWLTLANEHHAALISRAAPLAPLKKNRVLRYWLSQL
jgi:predicted AAA+ superfamily ATPase